MDNLPKLTTILSTYRCLSSYKKASIPLKINARRESDNLGLFWGVEKKTRELAFVWGYSKKKRMSDRFDTIFLMPERIE